LIHFRCFFALPPQYTAANSQRSHTVFEGWAEISKTTLPMAKFHASNWVVTIFTWLLEGLRIRDVWVAISVGRASGLRYNIKLDGPLRHGQSVAVEYENDDLRDF
jgi:hypothetical protein